MPSREETTRQYLTDLFAGPFPGHALLMGAPAVGASATDGLGDFTCSDEPVEKWLPWLLTNYENKVKWHEAIGDDAVPYVNLNTNTGIFAAAFGCELHVYDEETPACARPIVFDADGADKLETPPADAPPLSRIFELAKLARKEVGPDVPISVPDIQSPFDIAALIWEKIDFYIAAMQSPDAVKRLTAKCNDLLKAFLSEYQRRIGNVNMCHCPYAWARPELGVWLSEDEVGAISTEMFEQFALPSLTQLSETFGGIFMHCCATADHQYDNFKRVPNLRGLNRVFQEPGARPAIEAFTPDTVLMLAWYDEQKINETLDLALPETRFLFNLSACPIDEAKPAFERLRERCPRRSASTGLTTEVAEVTQQAKDG